MAYPKRQPGTTLQTDRIANKREALIDILRIKLRKKLNLTPDEDLQSHEELRALFLRKNVPNEQDIKQIEKKLRGGQRSLANSRKISASQSNLLRATGEHALGSSLPAVNHLKYTSVADTQGSLPNLKAKGATTVTSPQGARPLGFLKTEDEYWAQVMAKNVAEFQTEEQNIRKKEHEKREVIKAELAKQVRAKESVKKQEVRAEWDYHLLQQRLLQEEKARNSVKKETYDNKLKEEGNTRKKMIELAHARKANELREERELDLANRRRAEEERIKEAERERKKLEDYKKACRDQLEENKQLRQVILQKEQEEENKPPEGNDLMQVIYNVKPHQAYERRKRNDQQLALVMEKLAKGNTQKKYQQEIRAIEDYVQKKEVQDRIQDENKLRKLKNLENEMKRTLDRQVEERGVAKQLQKYADTIEKTQIKQNYGEYLKDEHKGKIQVERKVMHHQEQLNKQILEKQYMKQQSP